MADEVAEVGNVDESGDVDEGGDSFEEEDEDVKRSAGSFWRNLSKNVELSH